MNRLELCIIVLLILVLLTLFPSVAPGSNVQTDIKYGQAGDENLLLDACIPEGDGPFPIAIIVHGGGWDGGDKQRDITVLFKPLTKAKFIWFSINYRLAPEYKWPACLEDVQTAVRWIKAHAADYKGDPNRIALIGYSAGGQLICMAAALADDQMCVQAVIGLAPPTDLVLDTLRRGGLSVSLKGLFNFQNVDEKAWQLLWEASPVNHLKPDLPPFLLVHGTGDNSVPYQQSLNFQARCKAIGVQCDMITIDGAPHRISAWNSYGAGYKERIIGWLRRNINNDKQSEIHKSERNTTTNIHTSVITVSLDGTGDFKTVQAAVDAVQEGNIKPVVISIRPGTYRQRIIVPRTKRFIHFQGEDAKTTVLTFDLNARMTDVNGEEIGTFRTPSVTIEADDFSAENITFENSAGPVGQALAITVIGDRVVFRNCRFLGWQDTVLDQTGRHYYENCYIEGHVDFIFGGGTAYFEKCHIHCLRKGYITAAATPEHQAYGYVFSNCKIAGETPKVRTYLGRPWRDYANVIFLNTEMSEVVCPEGWNNWKKTHREKTARYAEFNCTGPGANPHAREPWSRQLTEVEAKILTVETVLAGVDGWNPITNKVSSSLNLVSALCSDIESLKKSAADDTSDGLAYLLTSFRGNGEDGLYLAYSNDGLNWKELGGSFLKPQIGSDKLMRDPSLIQSNDGIFHLVWTTSLQDDKGLGYACSKNLIDFSQQKFIKLMTEQQALYVVEPELFYDDLSNRFIIVWASTLPNNYYQAFQENVQDNPRLWYTKTSDFENFAPAKPFFEPGYSVRSCTICKYSTRYVLVHRDDRRMVKALRVAFADTPLGPWGPSSDALPLDSCKMPVALKLGNDFIFYFEMDNKRKYGAVTTHDFKAWKDITDFVSFPEGYHYGNILKVNSDVMRKLEQLQH